MDTLKLGALLRVVLDRDASPLPLQQTAIDAQIIGPVATVIIRQRFGNPFREAINLTYLFPVPEKGAVVDYTITIGTRTIQAALKEKQAARDAYQQAADAGRRASLLEQRQPNLFSIALANVQPGESIQTEITIEDRLVYSDGQYTFVVPMGITPKYHSPQQPGDGREVNPPTAGSHEPISPVELRLAANIGVSAGDPASPSHKITVERKGAAEFSLTLAEPSIPDKDFVLRYAVGEADVAAAAWVSTRPASPDAPDYALVTVVPPRRADLNAKSEAREFLYVIDRSGSMSGGPLEQAKNGVKVALRALSERDTFSIQAFDDKVEWFDATPRKVTQDAVNAAEKWLSKIDARGGTEIVGALDAALTVRADAERTCYIVFLTDGAVTDDEGALRALRKGRNQARVFTFGIGPSVNRSLLVKLAETGRGAAEFLTLKDDIEAAITRFQDRVSYPALLDLRLAWDGAETWDVYPALLPDVYIGQALEVAGRLKRTGGVTSLRVIGKRAGHPVEIPVAIPLASAHIPAIERLWAWARIEALFDQLRANPNEVESLRSQIISVALEHRIATAFTSFVAIDSEIAKQTAERDVEISTPLPEGLTFDVSGAEERARGITFTGGNVSFLMAAPSSVAASAVPRDAGDLDLPTFMRRERGSSERKVSGSARVSAAAPEGSIKALSRSQNMDGSWGSQSDVKPRETVVALRTFITAGHTTQSGNYRRQLLKAAQWLVAWLQGQTTASKDAGLALLVLRDLDQADGAQFESNLQVPFDRDAAIRMTP